MVRIVLAFLLALTLVGCGGSSDEPVKDEQTAAKTADAQATFACRNFRQMASDVSDEILNDAELRKAVKKIHEDARLSETLGIDQSATQMLAAVTNNDSKAFETAAGEFNESCKAGGV